MSIPDNILTVLKEVKDPHTGEVLIDANMIKDVKVSDKKVSLKLVPHGMGCMGCSMTSEMSREIEEKLKAAGYDTEIKISFK